MLSSMAVASSCFIWVYAASSPSTETVPIDQLFTECHAVAIRLKSVDFAFSLEMQGVGPRSMRLRERDGKVRADSFFSPYVPDAEGEHVQAFDGKTFRVFHAAEKQLGKTTHPTDAMLFMFSDPLCLPYQWMMKFPMSWPRAKSKALWLESATRAKLQPATTCNGVRCQSVRFEFPSGGWQIIEIADGLRFPIRWREFDSMGIAATEVVVQEWREYSTPDGTAILPTVVEDILRHSANGSIHESKTSLRVDLASIRINPVLSEDIFTIPESRAVQIYDEDTKELAIPEKGVIHKVKDDGTLEFNVKRIPAKSSSRTLAIVGGLIVAVLAAVAIRWSSQRNAK